MVLFSNGQFLTLITVFSQGDDNRKGGGFGIQERERARIHAGNDSQIVNSDLTSIILIVTIIVIIGVSSYALYKIYLIRRKSKQSKLK
ncbi:MAG TPA: hypothetical protein VFP49_10495 [Nitrososphaeraceae archaeon]|nr:hypothetical protein [Nitrososphaeraceae archaeon]